ncbi:MAG TPA: hypothetical protein VEC06_00800 [Paucimonas sp.]|nr:hypothetical protein [Paucimonas sp.]
MTGFRRAAAALQTLHADDRRWILAGLPERQRSAIQHHLDELDSLGFVDEDVLEEAVSALPANGGAMTSVERLRVARAADMYGVLEREPSGLIAQVLALDPWTWRTELLSLFPPPRRQSIQRAVDAGVTAAPDRDAYLIDALAHSLQAQEQSADSLHAKQVRESGIGARVAMLLQALKKTARVPLRVQAWIR